MNKEIQDKYSENGKFEVKEIKVNSNGKAYNCVVAVDFELLLKAQNALTETDVSGNKDNPKISVKMQPLKAGDKLLFFGWKEGDEEIRSKLLLRRKAALQLGKWVQEMTEEDFEEEDEEEKKS